MACQKVLTAKFLTAMYKQQFFHIAITSRTYWSFHFFFCHSDGYNIHCCYFNLHFPDWFNASMFLFSMWVYSSVNFLFLYSFSYEFVYCCQFVKTKQKLLSSVVHIFLNLSFVDLSGKGNFLLSKKDFKSLYEQICWLLCS